jgi:hypothetical protein
MRNMSIIAGILIAFAGCVDRVDAQQQPTFFVPMLNGGFVQMGGGAAPGPAPLMPMAPMAPLTGGLYSSPGHPGPIAPITPMAPMGTPICGRGGYASF